MERQRHTLKWLRFCFLSCFCGECPTLKRKSLLSWGFQFATVHSRWWVIPGTYFFKPKIKSHFNIIFMKFDIKILKMLKNLNGKKKKIYNMLKLCTSSWNISSRQPLLPPSKGVDWWPGCLFLWMLYLSCFDVCVLLKAGPLNCTFPQTQMAWAHCISPPAPLRLHQQERGDGGAFQEVQSLKIQVKSFLKILKKRTHQKTGKGYLSGPLRSCSTQAKITIACFCTCLDPSSDRPNSRGPPSVLY